MSKMSIESDRQNRKNAAADGGLGVSSVAGPATRR